MIDLTKPIRLKSTPECTAMVEGEAWHLVKPNSPFISPIWVTRSQLESDYENIPEFPKPREYWIHPGTMRAYLPCPGAVCPPEYLRVVELPEDGTPPELPA